MNQHKRTLPIHSLLVAAAVAIAGNARAQLGLPQLLPGDAAPSAAAGSQDFAALSRGGDRLLAVWQDRRSELTGTVSNGAYIQNNDVYGQVLDLNGHPAGEPFVVCQRPFSQEKARVAWNGTNWLVAWQSRRPTQYSTTLGVFAARVSPAGEVLDDPPIVIEDDDDANEMFPEVASDGDRWAVIWSDTATATSEHQVKAAIVHPSGLVLSKKVLAQGTSSLFPTNWSITHAQDRYLLAWDQGSLTGRFFDSALDPLGSSFVLSSGQGGRGPRVASNGSSFYAAWTNELPGGYDKRGTPVALDGTVAIPNGAPLGSSFVDEVSVAWDGTRWAIVWQDWNWSSGIATWRLRGVHAAPNGSPGAPFAFQAETYQLSAPVLADAGAAGEALVVWHDTRGGTADIQGARLGDAGASSPVVPVSVSSPLQTHPDIDGEESAGYLAVFLSHTSSGKRVLAQRLTGDGIAIDLEPIEVTSGSHRIHDPRVAWNGELWLVAWEERLSGSTLLTAQIYHRRVAQNGALLDPAPVPVMAGNQVDLAALGGDFLLASSEEPTDHLRYLRLIRVRAADGAVLGSVQTASSGWVRFPSVQAVGSRWLVTWQRNLTHDSPTSNVRACFVAPDGTPQGVFAPESSSTNTRSPVLASAGDEALIVFSDSANLRARRILADGTLLGPPSGFQLTTAPNAQFTPQAAFDGTEYLVAWTDYRIHPLLEAGVGDVYGTRVSMTGEVLDPLGLPFATDFFEPEGDPAVAGGGRNLAVYVDFRADGPHLGGRIVARAKLPTGVVGTPYCFGEFAACPCGNGGGAGEGCANSSGVGATLGAGGSTSVAADDLVLFGSQMLSGQPALLFAGLQATNGGAGAFFGDGLRCASTGVVRLGVRAPDVAGDATWGPGLGALGGWSQGETRYLQAWYRDPVAGPCGTGFNLSNGVEIAFTP